MVNGYGSANGSLYGSASGGSLYHSANSCDTVVTAQRLMSEYDTSPGADQRGRWRRSSNELVELNVGGQLFTTTRSTLDNAQPQSALANILAGQMNPVRDEQGRTFIDRDGHLFGEVLAFLRDGPDWRAPNDSAWCRKLAGEFLYYGIDAPQLAHKLSCHQQKEYILAVGGQDSDGPADKIQCFDPLLKAWAPIGCMTHPRVGCAAVALGGSIYIFGGDVELGDPKGKRGSRRQLDAPPHPGVSGLDRFDVEGRSVTALASMPLYVSGCAGVAAAGYVWSLGGMDLESAKADVHAYNPAVDAWFEQPALPRAAGEMSAVELGGSIFAMGGKDRATTDPELEQLHFNVYNEMYRLDPREGQWVMMPDIPAPVCSAASCVLNGRIYLMGGERSPRSFDSRVFCFDPVASRWSVVRTMRSPRRYVSAAVAGGQLYVVGGRAAGDLPSAQMETYNASSNSWTLEAGRLQLPLYGHATTVLQVEQEQGSSPSASSGLTAHPFMAHPISLSPASTAQAVPPSPAYSLMSARSDLSSLPSR